MATRAFALLVAGLMTVPMVPGALPGDGLGSPTTGPSVSAPPVERPVDEVLESGLLDTIGDGVHGVIVHFDDSVPAALAGVPGIQLLYTFESIPAAYVLADAAGVGTLSVLEAVAFVEDAWKPVAFSLDSATVASRARDVWEPSHSPSLDPIEVDGELVDGSGIGIAVVDTGIDPTHPDFLGTGKLGASFIATPAGMVEAPTINPQSPHGTMVAGVAAGNGLSSDGQYRGAAPGATLHDYAIELARDLGRNTNQVVVYGAMALDHIAAHGDELDPPVRVVQNAWHCQHPSCKELNPDQAHIQLAGVLAEEGYVVTWATGNHRTKEGQGAILPEATNPAPGVIGVASYNDEDFGLRNICYSSFSARGYPQDPGTWPDINAPGSFISSTWGAWADEDTRVHDVKNTYRKISGTSLASAHAAGIAALVLQANANLDPAEVEYVLKATAEKLGEPFCDTDYVAADPAHTWDGSNHEGGHGLVDAYAAVQEALSFSGIPDTMPPAETDLSSLYDEDEEGVVVDQRLYLADDGALVDQRPTGELGSQAVRLSNEPISFTSAPLADSLEITGIDASIYLTLPIEAVGEDYNFFVPARITVTVEQLDDDGNVLASASAFNEHFWTPTQRPRERPIITTLNDPILLDADDRVRVTIESEDPGLEDLAPPASHGVLHWGSADAPSHIGLGHVIDPVDPGSYEECRGLAPSFCAWTDADHPDPQWRCETHGLFRLTWSGPPGSRGILSCYGGTITCDIPEDADGWGTCTRISHWTALGGSGIHRCTFIPADDSNAGHGRCEVVAD